jgi:hypothetical protein
MQHRHLNLRNNVDLSELQLGRMLLLRPFVVGDTLTKLAGMFAVERLGQAGLKPIVRRVFDDHSHPCRRLENSPMPTKKLENSRKTKHLADTVLHGQVIAASIQAGEF